MEHYLDNAATTRVSDAAAQAALAAMTGEFGNPSSRHEAGTRAAQALKEHRAVIAGALGAERLIMMTDIAGILRDKDDPSTLIPHITVEEAKTLYDEGVISGGMIPKVDCCIEALGHGVKNVVIMDGRIPHSILMELLTDEGAGTMVTKG